jgi:glycosyltransferase involved in cell wall biosynthesis
MVECKKLRVLLVGTYPPPYGGIATHLVSLIPALMERGADDIAVVTLGSEDKIEAIDGAIIYRYDIKKYYRHIFLPSNWLLLFRVFMTLMTRGLEFRSVIRESIKAILINKIAKLHHSEVVAFYHSDAHFEMIPLIEHWKGKCGIVLTVFGEVYGSPVFIQKYKAIIEKMLELPDIVWASSNHCACSFKTVGINRQINTIYLGSDLGNKQDDSKRFEFRRDNNISSEDVVILFMGRFIKDMGLDVVLQIIPEMLNESQNIVFILAGARGHLSDQVTELSKNFQHRVLIFENFPFSIQDKMLAGSDVILAPSYDQRACMGLSIKEAMAASLPVVATKSGGIPEAVVHGETGFLVELDAKTKSADLSSFKEYIVTLVNDSQLRSRFGVEGRKRAEKLFSLVTTIDKVTATFNDAKLKRRVNDH